MFYDKPILSKANEFQIIINKQMAMKIIIHDMFQVGAIIAKLLPSWKGYGKKDFHNFKDFSLEQIQKHLHIKEESRARDKNDNSYVGTYKANVLTKSNPNKQKNLVPMKD